jgi:site-specific recombinase XerD
MARNGVLKVVGRQPVEVMPSRGKEAEAEAALIEDMLGGYEKRRLGSLGYDPETFKRDKARIREFLDFTGKPPWEWDENDFDAWCYDELVLARRLKTSSQRVYQRAIRSFLDYLVGNRTWQARTSQLCGSSIHQICNDGNCIPHLVENERAQSTRSMTHGEIEQFFSAIDREIEQTALFNCKGLLPIMRDKAMFYTQYCGGLRISENRGLDIGSFRPNPSFPEMNDFGATSVSGKGSRGSGPKHRTVPTTHLRFVLMMEWYLGEVRPLFMPKLKDANDKALFLSERGRRLSVSAIEQRFQKIIDLAGLGGMGFTTHSMRGSAATHLGLILSIETIRDILGHVYATTTLGYMQISEMFAKQEIEASVRVQLDMQRREETKNV